MRRTAVLLPLTTSVVLAVAARDARAQGFAVYEHDACAMARGGATVADPCPGGSAVFFNPAGVVGSPNRWNLSAGATLIAISFHYRDSLTGQTTDAVKNTIPVPAFYLTHQVNDRVALGIGAYAPYGLVVEWPTTFVGRFLSYHSELKSLYIQPTVAIKAAKNLRVGAGFIAARTSVDLRQRVDLSSQVAQGTTTFAQLGIPLGTDFAAAQVTGNTWSYGGQFGVIFEPTPKVSLGARYMLAMTANVDGNAAFTQVNTGIILPAGNPLGAPAGTPLDAVLTPQFAADSMLGAQKASGKLPLPDQLVAGVAVRPTPAWTLTFDYQWTNWSKFGSLPLTFANIGTVTREENYRNTSDYRFGVEYRTGHLALRGGALTHDGAAPDASVTPLLPEGARVEYTGGIGYDLSSRMRLDVAYQYIRQQDRRGRVVDPPPGGDGALYNTGLYTGGANLFGASLHVAF